MDEIEELRKLGLLSRAMSLGEEAHRHLTEIEKENKKENKKEKKNESQGRKQMCMNCGTISYDVLFKKYHKCSNPSVTNWDKERYDKREMPSMPMQVSYFKVSYKKKTYKFECYWSAKLFRRLLWIEKIPFEAVMKNNELKWFKEKIPDSWKKTKDWGILWR